MAESTPTDIKYEAITKLGAACRQLSAAIRLFFNHDEPVAVYTLAQAAWEITGQLLSHAGKPTIQGHAAEILGTSLKEVRRAATVHKNFFKHADQDPKEMVEFSDHENDHLLIMASMDLASYTNHKVPVEVQVFEMWYFTVYPERISAALANEWAEAIDHYFPRIASKRRAGQKEAGGEVLRRALTDPTVLCDPKTDRSLIRQRRS